ncbi:hypothetical protein FQN53_004042 [Emmonsiellopsis sp. PD_33]|nr:hypothetical protein FQN53_004042 [Emmonsiellopsis sp. PD_33]
MPYSLVDLNVALDLIREERSKLQGSTKSYLEDLVQAKYELRYRNRLTYPTTHIDHDTSGDFDPTEDRPRKRAKRPPKIKATASNSPLPEPFVQVGSSGESPPIHPGHAGVLVTFKFKTPGALCALAIVEQRKGEPIFSTMNPASPASPPTMQQQDSEISLDTLLPSQDIEDTIMGGCGNEDMTPFIPMKFETHGCHFCFNNNYLCLLSLNPESYPCQTCREHNVTCEPMATSQVGGQGSSGSCQPDTADEQLANNPNPNEPEASTSSELQDVERQLLHLLQEDAMQQCLEISNGDTPTVEPGPGSTPNKLPLFSDYKTFVELDKQIPKPTAAPSAPIPPAASSSSTSPPIDPKSPSDYNTIIPNISTIIPRKRRIGPITKTIQTSFAHPIDFTHQPSRNPSKPCHWCHDFTYGILGLGQIGVQVTDYRTGKGYTEIGPGHVSAGSEPSRMCSRCAMERICIIECNGTPATHKIVPIEGVDEKTFDEAAAFNSLFAVDSETGSCTAGNAWCSVCVSPAFNRCVGAPREDSLVHAMAEMGMGSGRGCGLVLCGRCAQVMREMKGNLSRTIVRRKKDGVEMRADVEFLSSESELYQRYERVVGFG